MLKIKTHNIWVALMISVLIPKAFSGTRADKALDKNIITQMKQLSLFEKKERQVNGISYPDIAENGALTQLGKRKTLFSDGAHLGDKQSETEGQRY
jgi:hypothetical protein